MRRASADGLLFRRAVARLFDFEEEALFFAVDLAAGLLAACFLAVDFLAVDFLAVVFFDVDFFAVDDVLDWLAEEVPLCAVPVTGEAARHTASSHAMERIHIEAGGAETTAFINSL
jgi:hypothetical protein